MNPFWIAPAVLQAIAILFDEFHFHRRRGLGRWELIGHPVDTAFFLLPLTLAATIPHDAHALRPYVFLSAFSCLLVTKDEWVHARLCAPAEHWLHSILFVIHPVVLFSGERIWAAGSSGDLWAERFQWAQIAAVTVFLVYQLACLALSKYRLNPLLSSQAAPSASRFPPDAP